MASIRRDHATERTGKAGSAQWPTAWCSAGKYPTFHQRLGSHRWRNAGESMTDIGRPYHFSHRTVRRL